MIDFIEIEEKKKTIKILNLDDFSVEELEAYCKELYVEIERVKKEKDKKNQIRKSAENFFK